MTDNPATAAAILSIVLPLAGAPLLFVLGRRGTRFIVPAVLASVAAAVALVLLEVVRHGPRRYALAGRPTPLGIELNVDGLAALMLVVTMTIVAAVSLFAVSPRTVAAEHAAGASATPEGRESQAAFWPLLLFLLASLNVLFLSSDIFNLYVGLELLGLAAVAMTTLAGGSDALSAAMRYLLVSLLGSMAYLLGVAFLYAEHGTLAVYELAAVVRTGPGAWTALVAMTAGLVLKTALFPFHGWLPAAHAGAPSPVSALLSGLVVKASFYVLLRLWVSVFSGVLIVPLVQLVGALGGLAIVWGGLVAIRQERLKLVIAFSTVSQLGYLFVLLPVALGGGIADEAGQVVYARGGDAAAVSAWQGGVYHALSHAVAKAAMFLAAGSVIHALGHDRVSGFTGLAARAPATVLAFSLAGLSLIGLPPSGGFLAKWLLISAAITREQWGWAVVMLAGSLLTAVYVFRVIDASMRDAGPGLPVLGAVPRAMTVAALALAVLSLLLGVWSVGPLAVLTASTGFPW